MARRWRCGLIALVACLPRQTSSFFACPSLPGAIARPARTATASTAVTATAAPGDTPPPEEGSAAGAAAAPPVPPSLDRSKPCAFIAKNNVNLDGDFITCKEGEPRAEELTNENLIKIVAQKGSDEGVNWILWKCLGYRYDADKDTWKAERVFPKWEERYPEPIDLIGVTRRYDRETDEPTLRAVQYLNRSVPSEYKRLLMDRLKPLGFSGLILDELTPNRTRRAQMVNFLLYFRENLWGVPLEEVERRRVERLAIDEKAKAVKRAAREAEAAKAQQQQEQQQQQQQSSTDED